MENVNTQYCQICECLEITTPNPDLCSKPEFIGDGYCDDITNTEKCDFDGGDCCVEQPNHRYCDNCTCIAA